MATTVASSSPTTGKAPTIQVYNHDHSLYCTKVKLALRQKGVPFTCLPVPAGGLKSAEYLAIVPLGKLPAVLVTEPGQTEPVVLMESDVIIEWLEDRLPAPHHLALLPESATEKALARMISRFHDLYFEAALRKVYPLVDPRARDPAAVASAVAELQERLRQLDVLLHQADAVVAEGATFAVGSRFTIADCGFVPAFWYSDLILGALLPPEQQLQYTPRLLAWRAALDADPVVQEILAVLRPHAQAWLDAKLQAGAPHT